MKKLTSPILYLGIIIGTSIGGGFCIFALGFYLFLKKEGYVVEQTDIRTILILLLIAFAGFLCATVSWAIFISRDLKKTIKSLNN